VLRKLGSRVGASLPDRSVDGVLLFAQQVGEVTTGEPVNARY